jgi:hypothetical protein
VLEEGQRRGALHAPAQLAAQRVECLQRVPAALNHAPGVHVHDAGAKARLVALELVMQVAQHRQEAILEYLHVHVWILVEQGLGDGRPWLSAMSVLGESCTRESSQASTPVQRREYERLLGAPASGAGLARLTAG